MALVHTVLVRTVFGDKRVVVTETLLDSSYPTGGSVILPTDVGLTRIDSVVPVNSLGGFNPGWDQTNKKLLVYQGDNTNAAAAPGIQVPNATNLAAFKANLLFIGA